MSPNEYKNILNRLSALEDNHNYLKEKLTQIAIDDQFHLRSNKPITAGTSCRVTYDTNGLILRGDALRVVDLPSIPIDKIINLSSVLEDKISKRDISKIESEIKSKIQTKDNQSTSSFTGIKIHYDENGHVISSSNLLVSDIPMLPVSHIEGLSELIQSFRNNPITVQESFTHPKTSASTFCKVTTDEYGHIIQGSNLTESDIPSSIINRINSLENRLTSLASNTSIQAINTTLSKKLTSNTPIKSGTFTKVTVDQNGLVIYGSKLNINDLPSISIQDITKLDQTLHNKVNREEFIQLSDTVSSISNTIFKLSNFSNGILDKYTSKEDHLSLANLVMLLDKKIDHTISKFPIDTLNDLLTDLKNQLSNIEGRISVLEKLLKVE